MGNFLMFCIGLFFSIKGRDMSYYIPLYGSESMALKGVSKEMEVVGWTDVPEKVRDLLLRNDSNIPESVAVTDNPNEIISTELNVLSFIFGKPYFVHQWANESTRCGFSPSYSITNESPRKQINDGDLEDFLKIAFPLSHKAEIQRILSYYYEIKFRTSSVQVKIITLVSLLEYIVSTHSFEKEEVIGKDWIKNSINSFIEETVRIGYFSNVAEAKDSGKVGLLRTSLGNINEQSMKTKIMVVCEKCGLNVNIGMLRDIYKVRNDWIHGGSADDMDYMVKAYAQLKQIVEMMIMYEITGRNEKYQWFMVPFSDKNEIIKWERFYE